MSIVAEIEIPGAPAHIAAPPLPRATVRDALSTVVDPDLDVPITELGFLQSISIIGADVAVRLHVPDAYQSSELALVVAADVADALYQVTGIGEVHVLVESCWLDSAAGDAVDDDAHERVRAGFARAAHDSAVRRVLRMMIDDGLTDADTLGRVLLRDIPRTPLRAALMRRRANLGLSLCPNSRVLEY